MDECGDVSPVLLGFVERIVRCTLPPGHTTWHSAYALPYRDGGFDEPRAVGWPRRRETEL